MSKQAERDAYFADVSRTDPNLSPYIRYDSDTEAYLAEMPDMDTKSSFDSPLKDSQGNEFPPNTPPSDYVHTILGASADPSPDRKHGAAAAAAAAALPRDEIPALEPDTESDMCDPMTGYTLASVDLPVEAHPVGDESEDYCTKCGKGNMGQCVCVELQFE